MESISLGSGGPLVSRVGLGLMGMSGVYGPADETESIATIQEAIDLGVTLLNTGDFYGMGHNELPSAGTCLHLPPGLPHCLENTGPQLMRVLGVFHPAGSPAAKLPHSPIRPE